MASDIVSLVTKEDLSGGWTPLEDEVFVHRVSSEMRAFDDEMNIDHDLVISDPKIKRVRTGDVDDVWGEYLQKRYIVGICEAFRPVAETLTKTMRTKISTWDGPASKDAFDAFFVPFQAAVAMNNRAVKLKKGAMWPRELTFGDLSLCLEKIRINFAGVPRLEQSLHIIEDFFEESIVEALTGLWSKFEESHLDLNDEETTVYEGLKNNPLSAISQWVAITNVDKERNIISHPFSVGKDFDLEDAKFELRLVEGACEKEVARHFKDVSKFCATYVKYSLYKAEVEIEEKTKSLDAMFHTA